MHVPHGRSHHQLDYFSLWWTRPARQGEVLDNPHPLRTGAFTDLADLLILAVTSILCRQSIDRSRCASRYDLMKSISTRKRQKEPNAERWIHTNGNIYRQNTGRESSIVGINRRVMR